MMKDRPFPVKSDKRKTPEWLQQLQLNSWEPEILLSGIVLLGLLQVPDLLDQLYAYLRVNFLNAFIDLDNLFVWLKIAIYWLTFGLILHLISRGIWVGMVGLSFTIPDGINFGRLRLSDRFEKHLSRIPSQEQIVISLEKLCSSLFSISFMLFMSLLGGYLYIFVLVLVPVVFYVLVVAGGNVEAVDSIWLAYYLLAVMLVGLLALIDFLTLGFFKRYKWMAALYWPFYRLVSAITLARFYRPVYYSFVSHFKKWQISLFLLFFVTVSLYLAGSWQYGDLESGPSGLSAIEMWHHKPGLTAYSGYYDDQQEHGFSFVAHIPSDVVEGNVLRLFVVLEADLEDSVRKHCRYPEPAPAFDGDRPETDLHCLAAFYQIVLDDSLLTGLEWRYHYKSRTRQRGLLTWIDIRDLPRGIHHLAVGGPEAMFEEPFAVIPFYRD